MGDGRFSYNHLKALGVYRLKPYIPPRYETDESLRERCWAVCGPMSAIGLFIRDTAGATLDVLARDLGLQRQVLGDPFGGDE